MTPRKPQSDPEPEGQPEEPTEATEPEDPEAVEMTLDDPDALTEDDLPEKPVPLFEGDRVRGVTLKVTGSADDRLLHELHLGESAVIVLSGSCVRVGFEEKDETLHRVQTVKAADMFVVADALDSADLVQKLRADRKRQLDEMLGTPPLPLADPDNVPDVLDVPLDGIPETDAEWDDALRDVIRGDDEDTDEPDSAG